MEVVRAQERSQEEMLAIARKQTSPISYVRLGNLFDGVTVDEFFHLPSARARSAFWNLMDQNLLSFTGDRKIVAVPKTKSTQT